MFKRNQSHSRIPVEVVSYAEYTANILCIIMMLFIMVDAYVGYAADRVVVSYKKVLLQIILSVILAASGVWKLIHIRINKPGFRYVYNGFKYLDILLMCVLLSTLKYGLLLWLVICIPIVNICMSQGFWASMPYMIFSLTAQFISMTVIPGIMNISDYVPDSVDFAHVHFYIAICLSFIALFRILEIYRNFYTQREQDNRKLVSELKQKYTDLEQARIERQKQYDKLIEVNMQLEDMNEKLSVSLAEFFTLQQISQAIGSIFDLDELLNYVNDIIIGVMGAAYSTIALLDDERKRLRVQTTNVKNTKERAILTDNINSSVLEDVLERGITIIDNSVDADIYAFTRGRDIKSLVCVRIQGKSKTCGLILIEHNIPNAFDDEKAKLLEIITRQISIAIENAKLYEQLQEYANMDGLTQIYNRLYFQNHLREELNQAKQQGYEVSVILMDVDNFKFYNDTYGHLFGDYVLQSVAMTIRELIRKDDIVARFGGEEFIILMPHTGIETAYEKAEELRRSISELAVCDQNKGIFESVSVSVGVSTYPVFAKNELELLNSADKALYTAKKMGKNCVALASAQDDESDIKMAQ